MKMTLLIFSIFLVLLTVALAVFIEPRSGNISGSGWTIPFWPFVLIIALALNPYIHDLVRYYFRHKVEIAKAEHGIVDKEVADTDEPPRPPPQEPHPTDIAKS